MQTIINEFHRFVETEIDLKKSEQLPSMDSSITQINKLMDNKKNAKIKSNNYESPLICSKK